MITDALYSANNYTCILFCVKHFELSHVMNIALLGSSVKLVCTSECPF